MRLASVRRGVIHTLQKKSCPCGYTLFIHAKQAGVVMCHKCRVRSRISDLGGGGAEVKQRASLRVPTAARKGKFRLPEVEPGPPEDPGGR